MSTTALRLLARSSAEIVRLAIGSCEPNVHEAANRSARDSLGAIFRSGEHFEYRLRFPNELAQSPKLRKGFACILSMLKRVLIATGSARTRRTAMHPTPCFAPDGRGHARFAGTRLGATARARKHRANVTMMSFFWRHIRAQLFFHRPKSSALLLAVSPQRSALPQAVPVRCASRCRQSLDCPHSLTRAAP